MIRFHKVVQLTVSSSVWYVALRKVQNQLREQVNRLFKENNKLTAEVTRLETQTERSAYLFGFVQRIPSFHFF